MSIHMTIPPEEPAGLSRPDAAPEREWTLSAPQVVLAVVLIVAACELIGVLS